MVLLLSEIDNNIVNVIMKNKLVTVDYTGLAVYIYLKDADIIKHEYFKTETLETKNKYVMFNVDLDDNNSPLGFELIFSDLLHLKKFINNITKFTNNIKDITCNNLSDKIEECPI